MIFPAERENHSHRKQRVRREIFTRFSSDLSCRDFRLNDSTRRRGHRTAVVLLPVEYSDYSSLTEPCWTSCALTWTSVEECHRRDLLEHHRCFVIPRGRNSKWRLTFRCWGIEHMLKVIGLQLWWGRVQWEEIVSKGIRFGRQEVCTVARGHGRGWWRWRWSFLLLEGVEQTDHRGFRRDEPCWSVPTLSLLLPEPSANLRSHGQRNLVRSFSRLRPSDV